MLKLNHLLRNWAKRVSKFEIKRCMSDNDKSVLQLKPRLTATSVIWSPCYYGHFFWPPGKNHHTFSRKKTLVNAATLLIWPNFFGLMVTVLTGFHCTENQMLMFSRNYQQLYSDNHYKLSLQMYFWLSGGFPKLWVLEKTKSESRVVRWVGWSTYTQGVWVDHFWGPIKVLENKLMQIFHWVNCKFHYISH